jgi:hypothetical protein
MERRRRKHKQLLDDVKERGEYWKLEGEARDLRLWSLFVCLFSWRYNQLWLYFHSPVAGFSLLVFEVSWSHTTTHHSRQDSSGRVINPSQRPLPDNTQHSQQTNIHALGGIRTHNLSRRAAEDLRLRPRDHWGRPLCGVIALKEAVDMSWDRLEYDELFMSNCNPWRWALWFKTCVDCMINVIF